MSYSAAINQLLGRLSEQATLYACASEPDREEMRFRGLTVAYTTAHTNSVTAARNLSRGFMMSAARVAIERRWKLDPDAWDKNQRTADGRRILYRWTVSTAKARFARALSGYSLGADAVCLDVHMLRLPVNRRPKNAYQQWAKWFRVYRERYRDARAYWCLDWHRRLLDYCALVPNVYVGE